MGKKAREVQMEDPEGESWHARAKARWDRMLDAAGGDGEVAVVAWSSDPEPLPDFSENVPVPVAREILGRFLHDRDTGLLHDCHAATPARGLDGITNGTFYHFWSEIPEDVQEADACPACLS